MKMYRQKQEIKLISSGISPDEDNLFDDCYGKKVRYAWEAKQEISLLKQDNQNNFLKIGRNLLEILDYHFINKSFDEHLKDELVKFKRTQAIKYMEAYSYCNNKYKKGQWTEECVRLGVEKLYLITRFKNTDKQEKLEKFVFDKNLSVKELKNLIEVLNEKNKSMCMAKEFNEQYC